MYIEKRPVGIIRKVYMRGRRNEKIRLGYKILIEASLYFSIKSKENHRGILRHYAYIRSKR